MLGIQLGGRYKLIKVLGTGGYGQTYVAQDTQRPGSPICVVKHLRPAGQNPDYLEIARRLFQTEAETLEKLGSHDQIPQLLAYFEENQEFYLVQEFIEGHPLSDELRRGTRLSESQVIALLQDVLGILEFVHTYQVIHRDIKPRNLLRRHKDGKLVLIDFGAVKQIQTQAVSEPETTGMTVGIGTQGYMPSEQSVGKPRLCSDIYALGMTAIQALTGLKPYQLPEDGNTSEVIWRDLAQVSEGLAAILDKMVRYHFRERYQSAGEVLQALQQLTQTAASPTLPSSIPYARTKRPPISTGLFVVAIATLAVTGLLLGVRQLGKLERLELGAFDQLLRLRPEEDQDERLLLVAITESDIQSRKEYPLHDGTLASVLEKLTQFKPRAIGIDMLRDVPQGTGRAALAFRLSKSDRIIAVCTLSGPETPGNPPAPGIPDQRIGFADLPLDPGGILRRALLISTPTPPKLPVTNPHICNNTAPENQLPSLGLQLAMLYLKPLGIEPELTQSGQIEIGHTVFKRLKNNAGGYRNADTSDYQILLNYRSRANVAKLVSVTDVLAGKIDPALVKDRIVLIGYTAPSVKDGFYTPYSVGQQDNQKMPGVVIHAQIVSQILSAVLNNRPLFWFWPEWCEVLWIWGWSLVGGTLAWRIRKPLFLGFALVAAIGILFGICYILIIRAGWIPLVPPALGLVVTGISVLSYWAFQAERQPRAISDQAPFAPVGNRQLLLTDALKETLPSQPVSFSSGARQTTVRGSLEPDRHQSYSLSCTQGQVLTLQALEGNINLIVIAPDGQIIGTLSGNAAHWQSLLPTDGDYIIEVSAPHASDFAVSFDLGNCGQGEGETNTITTT